MNIKVLIPLDKFSMMVGFRQMRGTEVVISDTAAPSRDVPLVLSSISSRANKQKQ